MLRIIVVIFSVELEAIELNKFMYATDEATDVNETKGVNSVDEIIELISEKLVIELVVLGIIIVNCVMLMFDEVI